MNFGLSYQGSKNKLAGRIVEHLPSAGTFIDLFSGGCAVTHAALLAGRWDRYVANDMQAIVPQCFRDAVAGRYANETRWIDRETFSRLKATDGYVRTCWSFGGNGEDYLYSREREPWKKALHYARVLHDFSLFHEFGIETDGSRLDIKRHHAEYKAKYLSWYISQFGPQSLERLQSLQRLQSLESLESLQRLERLQSLERLESSGLDYRDVEIPEGAVVYADPPYKGCLGYNGTTFDSEAFIEWCRTTPATVYISEYSMPADFYLVDEFSHRATFSATTNNAVIERLYCNKPPIRTILF